jgi:CO dehydrogenase maturation factor
MSFSIAVAGKGGTGKTTLAALIIRYLKRNGLVPVLAIDADPNANLGESLGLEVGQTVGSMIAGFNEDKIRLPPGMTKEAYLDFKLNETVVESKGLDLLTMGRGQGADCYCYPNLILRKFADSLVRNYPYMVMDNEAGMEHLSRKTTDNIDVLILVSNCTVKGIRAVAKIRDLVTELKLSIGSQIIVLTSTPERLEPVLSEEMNRLNIIADALIPCDEAIQKYDFEQRTLIDLPDDSPAVMAVSKLASNLLKDKGVSQ